MSSTNARPPRTALVLSAGGMFGAYQAGVWKALAGEIHPDLVVGASVGSLNGWAIAGGCSPAELEQRWLDFGQASRLKLRMPRSPRQGILDGGMFESRIRDLYHAYRPRTGYAAVLTDLLALQPRIFRGGEVTWEHLAASCAVLGLFEQRRIGSAVYGDGGLMSALPVWAAAELGATRIVAVNAMPRMPSAVVRAVVAGFRGLSRFRPDLPGGLWVIDVAPRQIPGSAFDLLRWNRANIERWIAEGQRDAEEQKHSIRECFDGE
jgi:NTE family protein